MVSYCLGLWCDTCFLIAFSRGVVHGFFIAHDLWRGTWFLIALLTTPLAVSWYRVSYPDLWRGTGFLIALTCGVVQGFLLP